MTEKRNQHGLNESEKAETDQMEAAGFTWDPARGMPRWTHRPLQLTALREHWMRDADWDKRRAEKIVEAAKLRRFDWLALGTRFRWQRHVDSRRRVYVKLDVDMVVQWEGSKQPTIGIQHVHSIMDLAAADREVVELFEPLDALTFGELEKLPKLPGVWTALADWHASQSAEAESQDYIEPMKWHDERQAMCKKIAADIQHQWENG